MPGGAWLSRVALALLASVILLSALTARVVTEGERHLAESDGAFDRGDLRESILHARSAAILYAPGAPHVAAAYARLEAIAIGAEASGQPEIARQAWGAVRSAAIETRHVVDPHRADLARANASLARLAAASPGRRSRGALAAAFSRDETLRARWVAVLGVGFGLFALGLGVLALQGFGVRGEPRPRILALAGALLAAGAASWTLAVLRA